MSTKTLPYWLDGGTERCEVCTHPHLLQAQFRCVGCDCAACEHCVDVDRETGEVLCATCRAAEEEAA